MPSPGNGSTVAMEETLTTQPLFWRTKTGHSRATRWNGGGRGRHLFDERRSSPPQPAPKHDVQVRSQALGEEGSSDMSPGRSGPTTLPLHGLVVQPDAERSEPLHHLPCASHAVGGERREKVRQIHVLAIDAVRQDVHRTVGLVGRDLHAGQEGEAESTCFLGRLVEPIAGVVVGQGDSRDTRGGGMAHHLGGRCRAI